MRQLSGMDDFFLHFERSGLPMHVGSVALYDPSSSRGGRPDFARILASIRRGVQRAPILRQRLVAVPLHLDRPYWISARDLDLDDHVRRISLARPASWEGLCAEVARIFEQPLDLAGALFDITVIEDLGGLAGLPPDAFALVTKVHHAALDGVSGVEIMRAFSDTSPEGEAPALSDDLPPESERSAAALLARAWLHRIERGVGAAKLAAKSLPMLTRSAGKASGRDELQPETRPVPRTRFNGRPSAERIFGGCHLDLADVQAIRSAVPGATVNDVVLTTVGGALRRYLAEHGELPADPVVAMAPISVRSEVSDGTGEAGGNRVSMMAVALGTDVASPLERLEGVRSTARSSKQRSRDAGSTTLLDLADVIPSAVGELAARAFRGLGLASRLPAFFSCVVTNVPGPSEPLFLAGSRMVATYGLGPIFDGVGLIHPVLSYDGGITIAFTSCPEMLPDPSRYEACLHGAFEELAVAAGLRDGASEASAGGLGT